MMSPNKTKKGVSATRDSSPEAGPSSSKRARSKLSSDDEEEAVPRKGKASSKYGSKFMSSPGFTSHNKPAQLFRKDLISAMKLADSEPLHEGSYFLISDPWRQEWEKEVQVPVNLTEIMQAEVKEICEKSKTGDFKMPHKMLHERVDCTYKKGLHELTGMQQLAEQLVRYDLDDLDVCWLEEVNFYRREMGLMQINEWNMERVMEALENQCHEKMTSVMKTEEGLGIEYDENVVCDVCRSPESEDTNEMVFCDGCDVCIHQACYGIQSIPEGKWLCRTCALHIKPVCLLCPKMGGAMKSTKSGTKWAHVSCALWIPEVSIGIPEKMEPITKISNIPPSRWALICCLCKERVGACIQCSVKTCKTAFHVTCGFSNGLEMKTILDDTDEHDGVKLKAYCPKHTKKRERGHSESDTDSPRKDSPSTPKKELTQQERDNLRLKKVQNLEEEFYSVVDVSEVCQNLLLEDEIVDLIYVYWKLKRKCNFDKPLLTPKTEEADILEKQQEDSLVARMKMFVHLRQDLERVRNLCYMIGKREKMKRQFFRSKEYVFTAMVRVLLDKTLSLAHADVDDIVLNYRFHSVYDDYGLSVPNLPPEPIQDEDDAGGSSGVRTKEEEEMVEGKVGENNAVEGEKEEKAESTVEESEVAPATGEEGAENAVTATAAVEEEEEEEEEVDVEVKEEEEIVEDPSLALPPGERYSGEFVRSGFFHRRRHKKWLKTSAGSGSSSKVMPKASKKHQPLKPQTLTLTSASETSTATSTANSFHVKNEKVVEDDSVFFASADETDDERDKRVPAQVRAGCGDTGKGDQVSESPQHQQQPPIPKLVVKSPLGPLASPSSHHHHHHRRRRHHHKKRHRGHKPWHVKKSHHYDNAPRIVSTDEEENTQEDRGEDMKVSPVLPESKTVVMKKEEEPGNDYLTVDVVGDGIGDHHHNHQNVKTHLDSPKLDSPKRESPKRDSPRKESPVRLSPKRASPLRASPMKDNIRDASDNVVKVPDSARTKPDRVKVNQDSSSRVKKSKCDNDRTSAKTKESESTRTRNEASEPEPDSGERVKAENVALASSKSPPVKREKEHRRRHHRHSESKRTSKREHRKWGPGGAVVDSEVNVSKQSDEGVETSGMSLQSVDSNSEVGVVKETELSVENAETSLLSASKARKPDKRPRDTEVNAKNETPSVDAEASSLLTAPKSRKLDRKSKEVEMDVKKGTVLSVSDAETASLSSTPKVRKHEKKTVDEEAGGKKEVLSSVIDVEKPVPSTPKSKKLDRKTHDTERDSTKTVTSPGEAETVPKSVKLERKTRERSGRNKKQEDRAGEGGEAQSKQTVAKNLSSPTDSNNRSRRRHQSKETSERSNIFESLERSRGEGSFDFPETSEPLRVPVSPNRHLSSDWHRKLKDLVDKADSSKLPDISKHNQPQSGHQLQKDSPHSLGDAEEGSNISQSEDHHFSPKGGCSKEDESGPLEPIISIALKSSRSAETSEASDIGESPERRRKSRHFDKVSTSSVSLMLERCQKDSHVVEASADDESQETVKQQQKSSHQAEADSGSPNFEPNKPDRKSNHPDETTLDIPSLEIGKNQQSDHSDDKPSVDSNDPAQVKHQQKNTRSDDIAVDSASQDPVKLLQESSHSAETTLSSPSQELGRLRQRSSHHNEAAPDSASQETFRRRRKSSHQARLKLSKVMAPDGSSDDDFEPSKSVAMSFPRRLRHDRHSKKRSTRRRAKDTDQSEQTTEEEEDDDEEEEEEEEEDSKEKRTLRPHRSSNKESSVDVNSSEKIPSRTRTGSLRPELNKLLKPSDLIVEEDLIKRVENSVLRRYSRHHRRRSHPANGILDSRQKQISSFFSKEDSSSPKPTGDKESSSPPRLLSKNRVLNEIPPEKSSGNFQNSLFGAHYSPRGSLSGYKIPKKNNNSGSATSAGTVTPTKDSTNSSPSRQSSPSPLASSAGGGGSSGVGGNIFGVMGAEFRSFRSEAAAAGSPRLRNRRADGGRGAGEEEEERISPRKQTHGPSFGGTGSDAETASVGSGDPCEATQFSIMDSCRGYRSQSPPSSEASSAAAPSAPRSDSRESTPRRFTRSRLADDMVENSPTHHSSGGVGVRMKLRDSVLGLKTSQLSSSS